MQNYSPLRSIAEESLLSLKAWKEMGWKKESRRNFKSHTTDARKIPFNSKTRGDMSHTNGSGMKSSFLELYKDYLSIKNGFLPRAGCL